MDTSLITVSDQQTIALQVFQIMAGIELEACEPMAIDPDAVSSMLSFSGAAVGSVLIDCSPQLSYAFTGGLMSIQLPTSVDFDVVDAMGELANMIGGNLKGLLPNDTCLSTPTVISPLRRCELLTEMRPISTTCFASAPGNCWISLLKPS